MALNLKTQKNKQKLAVVLMNLGGPDSLTAVKPFLYHLFSDPAIIPPFFSPKSSFRFLNIPLKSSLAWLISTLRSTKAKKIYEKIGGKSPLLDNTQLQARALEIELGERFPKWNVQIFIAMRYWHPFTAETFQIVKEFNPDKIILLPLYPQFSQTTSGSSLQEWYFQSNKQFDTITKEIPCYYDQSGFIEAMVELISHQLNNLSSPSKIRLLFSAHGLPQRNIDQGDPYQWQVEKSVFSVIAKLKEIHKDLFPFLLDYSICYQSKVGTLKWIGPSLDDEIQRAAKDQRGIIVIPISFVSEHSETLVELDMDYQKRAQDLHVPFYFRVPTVMDHEKFIKGLAILVENVLQDEASLNSRCPNDFSQCRCLRLV